MLRLTASLLRMEVPSDPLTIRAAEFLDLIVWAGGEDTAIELSGDDPASFCRRRTLQALRQRPALIGATTGNEAHAAFYAARAASDHPDLYDLAAFVGACPAQALGIFSPTDLGLSDPIFAAVAAEPPLDLPPEGLGSLVLIVKLTRRCNLRCHYCNDWREGAEQGMTPRVQALLLRRVAQDPTIASVRLIWHGGEPALLGLRRMLGFLWLQARLSRPGQHITNSVQTNGTVLTHEVVTLWRLFGFAVSVSMDGPQPQHDVQRPDRHGQGSFAAAARGIARLQEAGIFSGALVVATQSIAALPVSELVAGLMAAGVDHAAFLPVRPEANRGKGPYLPPVNFAQLLIRIFDHLRSNPQLRFDVRELDALHAAWAGQATGFCELEGPCLGGYFGIDPDGSIQHCDKFLGAADYRLGHLSETTFETLRTSPQLAALRVRAAADRSRLKVCRWFNCCKGWCPHESHIARLRGTADDCCGLAPIFEHFGQLVDAHAVEQEKIACLSV